ncbi:hypothetical protein [Yoonia sp. 2307UL14-13]|uniref:hypothetical protein n=1 Tax=Yoonia sp. 2307UL14-13 TaxID=3126506 RepID=UPI0030A82EDE
MRRRHQEGFVLAEALVALAIAALTLALLTSAVFGLRIASESRAAAAQTSAADWLAARRALADWAGGITASGRLNTESRIIGTATTARMVVMPEGTGRSVPFVGELRVEAVADGIYALIAARHFGQPDARVTADEPQETAVLRAFDPIRLLYLLPREGDVVGLSWRYETGSGDDGVPTAIGIEVGDRRMLTAPVFPTISASCLGALGPGGLEERRCALR